MVFFFRAVRRPKPSWRNRRRMVRRPAGVPIALSRRDNSRNDKLVHNIPAPILLRQPVEESLHLPFHIPRICFHAALLLELPPRLAAIIRFLTKSGKLSLTKS